MKLIVEEGKWGRFYLKKAPPPKKPALDKRAFAEFKKVA